MHLAVAIGSLKRFEMFLHLWVLVEVEMVSSWRSLNAAHSPHVFSVHFSSMHVSYEAHGFVSFGFLEMVSFWSLCMSFPCFVHTVFMAWRSHTQISQSRLCPCLSNALNINAMQQWPSDLSSCKWVSLVYGVERSCNGFVWLALRRLSHSNMAWKIKTLHVGKRQIHASCASREGHEPSSLTREHVSTLVPCPYLWQPSI